MESEKQPQNEQDVRLQRLESTVSALQGELNSIRQQLTAMGWTRASTSPPPPLLPQPLDPPTVKNTRSTAASLLHGSPATAFRTLAAQSTGSQSQSLESQLGSRVLSKLAVVLLLVGTAWFLKWAFDNRWVGPAGRICIGLLAGAAVVVWSERFRRQSMAAFSYALKAVGTGVLYLSLWAGFQLYHLFPAPVALIAMIAVTAANAFLAYSQNSQLLMGYAFLGAYLTPALLSTGGNHEVFLFSYLLAVALSVVSLIRVRPWPLLLCGALPMTIAYYIAWYTAHFNADEEATTLLFTILLWAAFAVVPVIAQEDTNPVIFSVLTPLGTATFGALAVYSVLVDSHNTNNWLPWAALLFAAAYLLLMRLRRGGLAAPIHLSLAVVFLTITIPLKATGRGITAGWLAEAVVLLWVATLPQADPRAKKALRLLGCASLLLGVAGALFGPLLPIYHGETAFLNHDFFTSLGALIALTAASTVSLRAAKSDDDHHKAQTIATGAFILGNIVLLAAMAHEIHNLYLHSSTTSWAAAREHADFTFSAWLMIQGIANLAVGFTLRIAFVRWAGLLLLGITLVKVFAYDMRSLGTGYHVLSYLGLGVVLMAVSFAYQKDLLHLREAVASGTPLTEEAMQP